MAAVALWTFVVALPAIGARASHGARVTADEPQYLTTAISIGEDFDLDISDELAERRFELYHEIDLNPQTIDLDDSGRRVSPHDPLLPALLAAPMLLGGWIAAKAALAVIAGAAAAATLWLAKAQARANHRSLEGEVRHLLTREVSEYLRTAAFLECADALAATTSGEKHTDGAVLIREDRDR